MVKDAQPMTRRTSRSPPAAGSPPPASRSTTTQTGRSPTPARSATSPRRPATPFRRPCRPHGPCQLDLRQRQPGVEHRRARRRDRHVYVHQQQGRGGSWSTSTRSPTTRRTSPSRPGAASPRPASLLDDDTDPTRPNSQSFDNVLAGGGYSLSQAVPGGWALTGRPAGRQLRSATSTCPPARSSRAPSRTRNAGSLVVVKDAQPNDAQDFSFTAGGRPQPLELLASTTTPTPPCPTRAPSRASRPAPPTRCHRPCRAAGTCRAPPATTATRPPPSPSPVQTVTCTFTNKKQGSIVVVQDTQPNDGQDFTFTAGGRPQPHDASSSTTTTTRRSSTPAPSRTSPPRAATRSPRRAVGAGSLTSATLRQRQLARRHHRGRRRDGHLHVRQPAGGDAHDRQGRRAQRRPGLRLHGRRAAQPDQLPARRRRERRALQHPAVQRPRARHLRGQRDIGPGGLGPGQRDVQRRQPGARRSS